MDNSIGNTLKPYSPEKKTVVVLKTLKRAWTPGLVHPTNRVYPWRQACDNKMYQDLPLFSGESLGTRLDHLAIEREHPNLTTKMVLAWNTCGRINKYTNEPLFLFYFMLPLIPPNTHTHTNYHRLGNFCGKNNSRVKFFVLKMFHRPTVPQCSAYTCILFSRV